jgi:hypothetical protein
VGNGRSVGGRGEERKGKGDKEPVKGLHIWFEENVHGNTKEELKYPFRT